MAHRLVDCAKCRKLVAVSGFGRCSICGDVITIEDLPSHRALVLQHRARRLVRDLGVVALFATGAGLIALSLHSMSLAGPPRVTARLIWVGLLLIGVGVRILIGRAFD